MRWPNQALHYVREDIKVLVESGIFSETDGLCFASADIPDPSAALHQAPTELKRQVFEAFGLQVVYDKPSRRIEISATITEAIADKNAKRPPAGGLKRRSKGHSGPGTPYAVTDGRAN